MLPSFHQYSYALFKFPSNKLTSLFPSELRCAFSRVFFTSAPNPIDVPLSLCAPDGSFPTHALKIRPPWTRFILSGAHGHKCIHGSTETFSH